MPKIARWLLDELPDRKSALSKLFDSNGAFRQLCSAYEEVDREIGALGSGDDLAIEADRLRKRRSALREEMLAFIGQNTFHH